jgi:hypothetical protein
MKKPQTQEQRVAKSLKVPPAKAQALVKAMLRHAERQQTKKGK